MRFSFYLLSCFLFALAVVSLPSIRADPVAGSALSALRFDYTFPNAPGSWVTLDSLSRIVSGNMTFEAWIALPLPGDGQYKPIVARYPDPVTLGFPDAAKNIFYTNRFTEWNFQVRPDGSLNIFMGGSNATNGASYIYGVNINSGVKLLPNHWHHVAFTIEQLPGAASPRAVRIFIDGVMVAGNEWSTNTQFYQRNQLQNTDPIELGRYQNPSIQLFNGWMDEIRFWDITRSEQDIANSRYSVIPGDTPSLLAYYRANEGTGFTLAPVPYTDTSVNTYDGALNNGTFWDVSGVQSLSQTVSVNQSAVSLVELFGSDTQYRPITYIIGSLPSRGKLFYAKNLNTAGAEITSVNASLTAWYVFYQSTGPIGNGYDEFTFFVRNDAMAVSAPAPVNVLLTPTVGCDGGAGSGLVVDACGVCGGNNTCVGCDGVAGSGKVFDACGVCGGMNSTCFCLDGEGVYRGFDESELDKVLLLYQIEQSIASLEDVDAKLGKLYDELVLADPDTLDLGDQISELRSWSSTCFAGFCTNLEGLFAQLSINATEPITEPVCGFSS